MSLTDRNVSDPANSQSKILEAISQFRGDTQSMLASMVDHYRHERLPMELFEALKMQVRYKLELPLLSSDDDELRTDAMDRQLEDGLLNACREAGTMLIEDGRIREGWMYLRPTADTSLARRLLSDVAITDDNYDDMVQVLLHEGIDIERGYQAIVDHQGTCNSITIYEQSLATRRRKDRQAAARVLLNHLYRELDTLIRSDIVRQESPADESESLFDMIDKRRWILQDGGYHLDTTHLASTVRIASVLDEPELLQKAWELTQYGRRLSHQFQYPGDEPFVDFYPAYATFYATLLGREVDAGLKFFERRARSIDTSEHGTAAIETYVDLLDRVGRPLQAIDTIIELVPRDIPTQRLTPLLIEIAGHLPPDADLARAYETILEYCRSQNDALSFVAVSQELDRRRPATD